MKFIGQLSIYLVFICSILLVSEFVDTSWQPDLLSHTDLLSLPSPVILPITSTLLAPSAMTDTQSSMVEMKQPLLTNSLIDKELLIRNQTHSFSIPESLYPDRDHQLFLELTYKIVTDEDAVEFDSPGFKISINQKPLFSEATHELGCLKFPCETEWRTKQLVLNVSTAPITLELWSGNQGDEQKNTTAIIKELKVTKQSVDSKLSSISITNFSIIEQADTTQTIEWSSIFENHQIDTIGKPLSYELKYGNHTNYTTEEWSQLPSVEVLLPNPDDLVLKKYGGIERRLIKKQLNSKFILLKAIDGQGNSSAIASIISA